MKKNTASRKPVSPRSRLITLAFAAAAMTSMVALAGLAGAVPPVGSDGQIHACYRVKGKPKGSLRIVTSAKKHCKRGERKVAWSVANSGGQSGGSGQAGAAGQAGSGGQQGQAGADGSSNEVALKTEIAGLALKIENLEGILGGISHSDLQGALGTLNGLNNTDLLGAVDAVEGLNNTELTKAVGALPVVNELCEQNEELTKQVNLLQNVIGGLGLEGVLGGLLKIPTLPTELEPFSCSTS